MQNKYNIMLIFVLRQKVRDKETEIDDWEAIYSPQSCQKHL